LPGLKPTAWECHKSVLPNHLFKKAQTVFEFIFRTH
jgi:hypothetical protein